MSNTGSQTTPEHAVVPVQSAWYSKVNWIAGLTALAATVTDLAPFVPPAYQHYVTVAVIVLGGLATIYARTFASATVTAASAAQAPVVSAEQAAVAAVNAVGSPFTTPVGGAVAVSEAIRAAVKP